jgi:hypothetical protein
METGNTIITQFHQLRKEWEVMNKNENNQLYGTMEANLLYRFI